MSLISKRVKYRSVCFSSNENEFVSYQEDCEGIIIDKYQYFIQKYMGGEVGMVAVNLDYYLIQKDDGSIDNVPCKFIMKIL